LGGWIIKVMCKVFYEKDYWIKKRAIIFIALF
jgi:hypothetical protein